MELKITLTLGTRNMEYSWQASAALRLSIANALGERENMPLAIGQGAPIVDFGGTTVGTWEVVESTPAREPNNPVLTQSQIVTGSTTVCIGCDEVIYEDRAEYEGEDQPYCPTCAAERGM